MQVTCFGSFLPRAASAAVLRLVSMLLGLLGIWGIAKLVREQVNLPATALTAGLVAINPAYLNMCLHLEGYLRYSLRAISHYARAITIAAASWLGFAMGLGLWVRANLLLLLAALVLATLIVLEKKLRLPAAHWMAGSDCA